MRVFGIDPAPAKGLTICADDGIDPESSEVKPKDAHQFIQRVSEAMDVLVCWDAPLTGPPAEFLKADYVPEKSQDKNGPNPYTQRLIDRELNSKNSLNTPKGISTLPYSQCSHWSISRSLLGLPRVGPYDRADNLPFTLLTEDVIPEGSGAYIVEVHPAVALWLWLHEDHAGEIKSWQYKSGKKNDKHEVLSKLWGQFRNLGCVCKVLGDKKGFPTSPDDNHTDDHLDAMVSYVLGKLWLAGDNSVRLYGDADAGAMLLSVQFEKFSSRLTGQEK